MIARMDKLRLGTRGSDLALWQTRWVAARLRALHPDLQLEEVVLETHAEGGRRALASASRCPGCPRLRRAQSQTATTLTQGEPKPAPRDLREAGAGPMLRGSHQLRSIESPSVKFDVATPPCASRCQNWKFHVSPAATATKPCGVGNRVRSRRNSRAPVALEAWT
jgi:hypothetical protein